MSLPLPFHTKHWIAIRRVAGTYYELDSKRREPLAIGKTDSDVVEFLAARLNGDEAAKRDRRTELLLVLTAEVFQTRCWKRDSGVDLTEQF